MSFIMRTNNLSKINIFFNRVREFHIIGAMQKIECMGCQTSFRDNEKLILQNLTTQYKNFSLPLKDDKAKWTILKTIGGTIYIGIEDNQGAVQGVFLQRKQMDNFKLFMKHLIEKIYPKVDLINKQQIVIQFVPALKDHLFQGKYVVKIIVQQGDPSQVYFFGEKIKLEGANNKIDQFQIFYAYERHNMGGTTEIKGIKLLQAVHSRAKTPNKIGNTFHQGCNPQPPHLELEIRKIHFANTSKQHLKILQSAFKQQFEKLDIDYEAQYLRDEKTICLTLQQEADCKVVQNFIVSNIEYLNDEVFKDQDVNFEVKGEKNHYFLILNNQSVKKPVKEEKSSKKEQKQAKSQQKNSNSKTKQEVQRPKQQYQKPKRQVQKPVQIPRVIESPKKNFSKRYSYTFTHIQPRAINQLQAYLNNSICRNYQKHIVKYVNTIEVFLNSQEQFQRYVLTVHERQDKLAAFGFKGEMRMGRNIGALRVCNYDKNKRNNMAEELLLLIGTQLKELNFVKDGNSYSLLCQFKDKSSACQWLDRLLQGRHLSKYGNSGSDKKNSRVYKLKIYLELEQIVQ